MKRALIAIAMTLSLVACGDVSSEIFIVSRAGVAPETNCFDVCRAGLGEEDIDGCVEILDDADEPAVACVLEPAYRVVERSMRIEPIVLDDADFDCDAVCGSALLGTDSDELMSCAAAKTPEGEPVALCGVEWDTPKSNAF